MTTQRVAFVDLLVLRRAPGGIEVLVLHRAAGQDRAGTWEAVHGTIESGETPVATARRELGEETGLAPLRFYNLSRVEQFYLHGTDEIALIPAFAAMVESSAQVRLGPEHDACEWLPPEPAAQRVTWPRTARTILDAGRLLGAGDAGLVEAVLRIE